MASKYRETDLTQIQPISISERTSKVTIEHIAEPPAATDLPSGSVLERQFPDVLAGGELKSFAHDLRRARDDRREIVWMTGAHVIKCGLSRYLGALMRERFITTIATTGSAVIHDLELAFFGATSEDVGEELPRGRFGMVRETAAHFASLCESSAGETGLGEGVGRYIIDRQAPHRDCSVFAAAYEASVPATVHVAFGTDIVHQHSDFPAETAGALTMRDFRIFTHSVGEMFDRGAVVIFGSAVVLPEVFLKAVSVNYNLRKTPTGVTSAGFDMMQQYRVRENVLRRPFPADTRRHSFIGPHEIMLPLLYSLLMGGSTP